MEWNTSGLSMGLGTSPSLNLPDPSSELAIAFNFWGRTPFFTLPLFHFQLHTPWRLQQQGYCSCIILHLIFEGLYFRRSHGFRAVCKIYSTSVFVTFSRFCTWYPRWRHCSASSAWMESQSIVGQTYWSTRSAGQMCTLVQGHIH